MDGVRKLLGKRNFMRAMKLGDQVLFYHSSAKPSGAAGLAEVVREAYPDHTSWDPKNHHHFDPKSTPERPLWSMVDVRYVGTFKHFLPLEELKKIPELPGMVLFNFAAGCRCSRSRRKHFKLIVKLGQPRKGWTVTVKSADDALRRATVRAHLLAEGQFEVVAVGIGDERPIAHRIADCRAAPSSGASPAATGAADQTIDVGLARAADPEMRPAAQLRAFRTMLDEHDHERPGAVRDPRHLHPARGDVGAAMDDRHAGIGAVEGEAPTQIGAPAGRHG